MKKLHCLRLAIVAGLLAASASTPAFAVEPPPSAGPVARVAILGSKHEGRFRTSALSISVGFGEGMEGAIFGSAEAGVIGTGVGNGIIRVKDIDGDENPFETVVCETTCDVLTPDN